MKTEDFVQEIFTKEIIKLKGKKEYIFWKRDI